MAERSEAVRKQKRIKYWQCELCHHIVSCNQEPSPRLVVNYSVPLDGKNLHKASGKCVISRGYAAVCFGPDRGEDYQSHQWKRILKRDIPSNQVIYVGK